MVLLLIFKSFLPEGSLPGRGRAALLWVPTVGFSPQDVCSRGFRSCGMRLMRTNLFDDVFSSGASPAR